MKTPVPALLALALSAPAVQAASVPEPSAHLGLAVGADRTLADWTQIVSYFHALDAASPRVRVEDVGPTTEGRPFLVVTISSEANMARLEEIRQANLRLADPRGLDEAEARRLIGSGPAIVAVHHAIHSTEVAATQTAMETAHWLASAEDEQTRRILDRVVVVMVPSHNPDGTQEVTEWYRASLGKPWEGRDLPFLYHHYAGHDNNRDWYMFSLAESRLTARHVYDRWRPQVVYDLHQMGRRTARLFAPPYVDPWEPNVDPALITAVNALGAHVAAELTSEGLTGVAVHAVYDAYSPARAYPHTHGGIRILTESASAQMATPVDVKFEDLEAGIGYDPKVRSWNFPAPWPGGRWRMRDIMDYQRAATRAILGHAAAHAPFWRRLMHDVNRRSAARKEPFAFVIPSGQRDPLAAARMLDALLVGGVEVHTATAAFTAGGRGFPAGSRVIPMAQPFSGFAKTLLERQKYPDLRMWRGGPPQRPYDVTAHTLPLLLGVEVEAVAAPFEAPLVRLATATVEPGRIERGRGSWLALGHANADLVAAGRLLDAGVAVRWARAAFTDRGRSFPAGALLVPASARRRVEGLARDLGVVARPVSQAPLSWTLRRPRVGLYQSYVASMDEGWTRLVFEKDLGVPYETLHDADVRKGALRARYDVIVLPDQTAAQIRKGHTGDGVPPEYRGGLGEEGVKALRAFVEEGGTLVALDSATELPIQEFGLPVTNVLAPFARRSVGEDAAPVEEKGEEGFYSPGAILEVGVDAASPIVHGLPDRTPIWFEQSPAFEAKTGRVAARYGEGDPLLSGWLLGGKHLRGKAALLDLPLGKGRVVLFGFRPQYRAQSWTTYVALVNALYSSVFDAPPDPRPQR